MEVKLELPWKDASFPSGHLHQYNEVVEEAEFEEGEEDVRNPQEAEAVEETAGEETAGEQGKQLHYEKPSLAVVPSFECRDQESMA